MSQGILPLARSIGLSGFLRWLLAVAAVIAVGAAFAADITGLAIVFAALRGRSRGPGLSDLAGATGIRRHLNRARQGGLPLRHARLRRLGTRPRSRGIAAPWRVSRRSRCAGGGPGGVDGRPDGRPTRLVADVALEDVAVFILPGGDRWEQEALDPALRDLLHRLDAGGVPLAAICAATTAIAGAGLPPRRRHTSNGLAYLQASCPAYQRRGTVRGRARNPRPGAHHRERARRRGVRRGDHGRTRRAERP